MKDNVEFNEYHPPLRYDTYDRMMPGTYVSNGVNDVEAFDFQDHPNSLDIFMLIFWLLVFFTPLGLFSWIIDLFKGSKSNGAKS